MTRTLILGRDINMASQSTSTGATQRRRRVFNVQEALELLETMGSDVEEDNESSDDDFVVSEADVSSSDDDEWQVNNAPGDAVGDESNNDEPAVDQGTEPDRGADRGADEDFERALLQPWNQNFAFFPVVPDFYGQEQSGLHVDHMERHAPLDFFDQLFDDRILQHICEQSNKYAGETIRRPLSKGSIFRYFHDQGLTVNDIVGFLSICVHMSLVHKPEIADYWSTCPILGSTFASSIMPRDKFCMMLAVLHVSDNDRYVPRGTPGHDPLAKIRPVYEHMRNRYKALYTPGVNICVDEAMCPWRGNLAFRVYMKDKPVKWGIKFYELCESETAYVFDFEIFAAIPGLSNRPVDVVTRLAEPLLDKGRRIYVDNYYCCPELAEALALRSTHTVGTVRANRKEMPPQLKTTPLPRQGEIQAFRQGMFYYPDFLLYFCLFLLFSPWLFSLHA